MYKLPKDIDLSFLTGKELTQVCIGQNDLMLHFHERIRITITSKCSYKDNIGKEIKIDEYPKDASLVSKLLGIRISEVQGDESGTLTLKFETGDTLTILDDSDHYESYTIKTPDIEIIV